MATSISSAVGLQARSAAVGYNLKAGTISATTSYLPQRVVILGEGATASQETMPLISTEVLTASDAGKLYGYGSPIHKIFNILKPSGNDRLQGIPTYVIASPEQETSAGTTVTAAVTGTVTANANQTLLIAGREFDFTVLKDQTADEVAQNIADVVNSDLSSPVIATAATGEVSFVSKWKGLSSLFKVEMSVNNDDVGLIYAITTLDFGVGAADLSNIADTLGEEWTTIVINGHGINAFDELEAINGKPNDDNPTGLYSGGFSPFISIWGSTLTLDEMVAITDERPLEVTHALAPAPMSPAFGFEAAANMAILFATNSQNTPHLGVLDKSYIDMPTPQDGNIGDMKTYIYRDAAVKKGCSTVSMSDGVYTVKDFVTTYHPEGETNPTYQWARNLMIDFNVRYQVMVKEQIYLLKKAIVSDTNASSTTGTMRSVDWKAILVTTAGELAGLSLLYSADGMVSTIVVQQDPSNPDRFNTTFSYTTSGYSRIASTTATVFRQSFL